ncbi:angiopoietin-related protein 6 [Gadus chalcogrammus]|uniref:angiopoietin-related protein 6 n=1 Tax=Gadus chalcogrammus TaxID=1042646 RepID=UPI0024C3966B|nr:angiopoietin-related protein 6 [Gadus chalcogrammus]
MEKTLTLSLVMLFLTLHLGLPEVLGRTEDPHADVNVKKRPPHASEAKSGRCSYTFIVPQQKLKGALCVSTAHETNRSEVASLRVELARQQEHLETLRAQLEREGSQAMEVRALRTESNSLNTRITQLYAQLLHEVIDKKDQVLEQKRVESLLLNATTQALQVSSNFRELEKKYGALTSMITSQNQFIARLEKQCQCRNTTLASPVTPEPERLRSQEHHNISSEASATSNDVQRDQSGPPSQEDKLIGKATVPTITTASTPTDHPFISFPVTKTPGPWRDCQHAMDSGETISGIYLLRPQGANRLLQAWCDQTSAQGGWTVIQRRQDGSVNFFRTWEQYKQGFGNLDGEYWLGLEHLYWLTKQTHYKLRVALEDWQGRQVYAEYDSFYIEPESDWYRLRLGEYQGNAGDSLSWHNNKAFTTLDRDKDGFSGNCAHFQKGGWWYHMCAHSNLNGVWYRGGHYRSRYQDGVYWAEFHGGSYSLKRVAMMIKPA